MEKQRSIDAFVQISTFNRNAKSSRVSADSVPSIQISAYAHLEEGAKFPTELQKEIGTAI